VRLREDTVCGLAEVLVHVQRVRTDDDGDFHASTWLVRPLRLSVSLVGLFKIIV
jgi:hypothetical protein